MKYTSAVPPAVCLIKIPYFKLLHVIIWGIFLLIPLLLSASHRALKFTSLHLSEQISSKQTSVCPPRPGYGPGEHILFPPNSGFRNVWTILYLNKDQEFSWAFPMSEGDWGTGDWFRIRHPLMDHGVNIFGTYISDLQGNVTGGKSQRFAYADCIDVRLDLDMEKLIGWKGAHFVFSFLDRNGRNLSQNIGNEFIVAEVYGTQTISYYALWLDQTFLDGWWNIKIGRLAVTDDFGFSAMYGPYVSAGINTAPLAFPVSGYLATYPATTWGSRLRFNEKKYNLYAMFGIYQPTNRLYKPAYHGLDFSIRRTDGINLIGEVGWTPEFHPPEKSERGTKKTVSPLSSSKQGGHVMPGNYKFGVYYTPWRDIPQFYPNKNTFYTYGFYWVCDQMVYQAVPGTDRGLTLWTALIYSPPQNTALLPFQGIWGAMYTGLIPRRSHDQSLIALIYGTFSKDYASLQQVQGRGYPTYEIVLEASYRINLSTYFFIQPDIQYVIRPGGTGKIANALVIGAEIGFSF